MKIIHVNLSIFVFCFYFCLCNTIFFAAFELQIYTLILKPPNSNPLFSRMEVQRRGSVWPTDFRNVKDYPSGANYHQMDYGLMDDFILPTQFVSGS